jgi:hypothetical protein
MWVGESEQDSFCSFDWLAAFIEHLDLGRRLHFLVDRVGQGASDQQDSGYQDQEDAS